MDAIFFSDDAEVEVGREFIFRPSHSTPVLVILSFATDLVCSTHECGHYDQLLSEPQSVWVAIPRALKIHRTLATSVPSTHPAISYRFLRRFA